MRAESTSTPIPPKIKTPPSLAWFAAGVLGATALVAGAVVFFFNPSTYGFYPTCLFHRLTGLYCPGCGGTRAMYALLHGRLQVALKDNALFVALLVATAARGAWFARKIIRRQPIGQFFPTKWLWPLLAGAVVFTLLRNLPALAFLSP